VQKTLQTHYITKVSTCFVYNLNIFFISDAIISSKGVPTCNNDYFMGYLNMLDISFACTRVAPKMTTFSCTFPSSKCQWWTFFSASLCIFNFAIICSFATFNCKTWIYYLNMITIVAILLKKNAIINGWCLNGPKEN